MIRLTMHLKTGISYFKIDKTTFYPTTSKITVNIESKNLNKWLKPEFKTLKIKF